jgi:hypothetical protein
MIQIITFHCVYCGFTIDASQEIHGWEIIFYKKQRLIK